MLNSFTLPEKQIAYQQIAYQQIRLDCRILIKLTHASKNELVETRKAEANLLRPSQFFSLITYQNTRRMLEKCLPLAL